MTKAIKQIHTAFFIYQEQEKRQEHTYDYHTVVLRLANKHVRTYAHTHVLVRQDLLQHLQGVFQTFFSVVVCLSRLNC